MLCSPTPILVAGCTTNLLPGSLSATGISTCGAIAVLLKDAEELQSWLKSKKDSANQRIKGIANTWGQGQ